MVAKTESLYNMQLTEANYYSKEADAEYMSVSQYKRWLACPAAAKAQYVDGTYAPEQTGALLHGQYFHGLFDGTAEEVLSNNLDKLLTGKGEKIAEIKKLDKAFERVNQDPVFMKYVSGDDTQREHIITAELGGVKWKCKPDVIGFDRGFFTDIKAMKDFDTIYDEKLKHRVEWWLAYHYDIQLAVYQKIIELSTGYKLDAYIAAVTKEKVPDYEVYDFNSEDMDTHFAGIINNVKTDMLGIDLVKSGYETRRCEQCDYCKQTKMLNSVKIARI